MQNIFKIILIVASMMSVAICSYLLSELDMYVTFLFYLIFISATTVDVNYVIPNPEVIRPHFENRLYRSALILK
jgi:hypothetical protein